MALDRLARAVELSTRRLDAELALADLPGSDDPASHSDNLHRAVAHVLLGKMRFVGDFHSANFGFDLCVRQLAKDLRRFRLQRGGGNREHNQSMKKLAHTVLSNPRKSDDKGRGRGDSKHGGYTPMSLEE